MTERTTVTYLEMTDPGRLRPAAEVPGLELVPAEAASPLVRAVLTRVAAPYGWAVAEWTDAQWADWTARPGLRHWLLTLDGAEVGVVQALPEPGGAVQITKFGLVPEAVGRGLGGHALTLALRAAWSLRPRDAVRVRRVWLHTCTRDHPHALPNYRARGMSVTRTEVR
jgi:GNAT superfamily N-acetyltransferase